MTQESGKGTIEELLAHREWARSLARCLVRGDAAVEDVVQQAYLRAMFYGFPAAARQRQWLGQVIRNVVRRGWQVEEGERRRRELAVPRDALHHPATDELVEQVELQRRLADNVLALDEPYRSVVILRYFEDLPLVEIAARVGAPVQTVRTRLKRALKQLRRRFDDTERGSGNAWRLQALALAQGLRSAGRGGAGELLPGEGRQVPGAKWLRGWTSRHAALFVVVTLFLLAGGIALVTLTGNRGSTGELSVVAGVLPAAAGNITSPIDGADGRPEPQPLAADVVPARRVTGRVLNRETGQPVANALAHVRIFDGTWTAGEAETDSGGAFNLSCSPVERGSEKSAAGNENFLWMPSIEVHAAELAPYRKSILDEGIITKAWRDGATAELGDMTLDRGTRITGRVTLGASGAGVADGILYLCHPLEMCDELMRPVRVGSTDADGNFELPERLGALREAPWKYYLVVRSRSCGLGWADVAVAPKEEQQQVNLVIVKCCTLAVRVVDLDGRPVARPSVVVTPLWSPLRAVDDWFTKPHWPGFRGWEPEIIRDLIRVTGGEDGVAVFSMLPANSGPHPKTSGDAALGSGAGIFGVCAGSRTGLHGDMMPLELDAGPGMKDVVITVEPIPDGSTILGRVVDSNGRPLEGALVTAPMNWVSRKTVATDVQGAFRITIPHLTSYEVTCRVDAARHASREEVVTVAPGGEARLDCMLLEERPLGGLIQDEDGHPVQGARVFAQPGDVGSGQYSLAPRRQGNEVLGTEPTAVDGRFRIEGATAGRWMLTVFPPEGLTWAQGYTFTVEGGSEDIELTLHHVRHFPTAIMVRAFDAASGKDVELCAASTCWLRGNFSGDVAEPETVIAPDARSVLIPHLGPGSWRLWVMAPGGATGRLDIELSTATAGTTLEQEVGVGASGRIEGFVTGARSGAVELRLAGPPQPCEWQIAGRDGEATTAPCTEHGTFSFTGLVGGSYDLKYSADDEVAIARVTVAAGASAKAVLSASRCGIVHFENPSATEAVRLTVEYADEFVEQHVLSPSNPDESVADLSLPEGPVRWTACSTRWPAFQADQHDVAGTVDVTAGSEVTVPLIVPE